MTRWVSRYLYENEQELRDLLRDISMQEEEELNSWQKMKRFEKIASLRQETRNQEIEKNPPTWGIGKEIIKESSALFNKDNISAIMPVGGEERGGDSRLSPPL